MLTFRFKKEGLKGSLAKRHHLKHNKTLRRGALYHLEGSFLSRWDEKTSMLFKIAGWLRKILDLSLPV